MTLLIVLGIFAIALFFMFKFTMIGTHILGKGMAKRIIEERGVDLEDFEPSENSVIIEKVKKKRGKQT